ncbi:hypothetical protein [Pantoea coffeiphila]|uniref:hypothetical protein n=1 Tax=Pantoea coffeiphila TaxID=1465635 RepID=UPI0011AFFCE8|nr:hypothetical protein [Pantoea coffeiphila]
MPEITAVCCDDEEHFMDKEVSASIAESYEDEVEQIYDSNEGRNYPEPESYFKWAEKHNLDYGSCSECGSGG